MQKPTTGPGAKIREARPMSSGFLKVTRYEFETDRHDGGRQTLVREVMERGHAVAVLGYDPARDEVVLVNEFRPGCMVAGDPPFTDNLCAGGIDRGESPLDAAAREMEEETGLKLAEPVLVHPGAYVSSGGTSEKIAIVVGYVDTSRVQGPRGNSHETEDTLPVVLPVDTFLARVRTGEITDLKTLVAGYWLAEHRDELRRARAIH